MRREKVGKGEGKKMVTVVDLKKMKR